MIRIEETQVVGFEAAIRGMRNPMNSWGKSDSGWEDKLPANADGLIVDSDSEWNYLVGPNDHKLMNQLAKGGPVHAKYARMLEVYVDITAPLYWWKEFDTYKVGTVANSCSTMHKIQAKEFTLDDFSHEHLLAFADDRESLSSKGALTYLIELLNQYRNLYNNCNDEDIKKIYWWQMIQLLPSSYNQRRTVMLSYEVLVGIFKWRRNHKLDEWKEFCDWILTLPLSELITREES